MQALGSASDFLMIAAAYSALGYSVIPLLGDAAPDRPKTPAVEWKAYQSRRATESDFLRWFHDARFQGIGLITGRISNLVVLDFDDPALYHAFCTRHPDLAELQVIQTRRGCHIYYHLPPHLHIQTRKGQGIDLLAGGCYVVARPTTIAGFAYTLIKGGQPKVLTQQHINRINQFFDAHEPSPLTPLPQGEGRQKEGGSSHREAAHRSAPTDSGARRDSFSSPPLYAVERGAGGEDAHKHQPKRFFSEILTPSQPPPQAMEESNIANLFPPRLRGGLGRDQNSQYIVKVMGEDTLHALYRAQIAKGRNQALFNVAITARDHGWSQSAVQMALVDLHALTISPNHPQESTVQRQREALSTIRSAFSKPARPARPIRATSPQMPTSLREKLYDLKLTCVVRTLEGLREKGIQTGQRFTRKQAHMLLKGLVGRDSIDHALNALAPDGQLIVTREAAPPLEPPPASSDAAREASLTELKNCVSEGATKSGQLKRGKKNRRHIMPSNSQLVYRLGVRFSGSDPLQPDDLASAKKTRQATHRELIRRRPGQYYRRWLSKRLGVSSRTTQRYDSELHVHVQPMFDQRPITWDNLNAIPDEPVPGMFLMDDSGRRYPAKRDIAVHLLPRVYALYLMRQEANFYSLDEPRVVFNQVWKYRREQQARIEQRISSEQGRADLLPAAPFHPAAQPRSGIPPPTIATIPPRQEQPEQMPKPGNFGKLAPKLSKRAARQALPDAHQEALAQRVYNLINARTPEKQNRISQASARHAVFTYGTYAVERALKTLGARHYITKPAGFFMTLLRSEQRQMAR